RHRGCPGPCHARTAHCAYWKEYGGGVPLVNNSPDQAVRGSTGPGPRSATHDERECQPFLVLGLALLVGLVRLADLAGAEEEGLDDALAGVDLRRQRRHVAEFGRDPAAPLRREEAEVPLVVHERARVDFLRIDDGTPDVGQPVECWTRMVRGVHQV